MAESLLTQPVRLIRFQSFKELPNYAESNPNSETTDSAFGKGSQDISSDDDESPPMSTETSDGQEVSPFKWEVSNSGLDVSPRDLEGGIIEQVASFSDLDRGHCGTAAKPTMEMTPQELKEHYDSKITYITDQGMY